MLAYKALNKTARIITASKLVEIFYLVDEFCKEYNKITIEHRLAASNRKEHGNKSLYLNDDKLIMIMILFHLSQY